MRTATRRLLPTIWIQAKPWFEKQDREAASAFCVPTQREKRKGWNAPSGCTSIGSTSKPTVSTFGSSQSKFAGRTFKAEDLAGLVAQLATDGTGNESRGIRHARGVEPMLLITYSQFTVLSDESWASRPQAESLALIEHG